jgi:hypothetical protein
MIHIFMPTDTPLPRIVADWAGNSIEIEGQKIPLC